MSIISTDIEAAVINAILAGRIKPGARLGESQLAEVYGVSRTRVREAMMRLETRGIVQVSARRGWFVLEPSAEDARAAFEARRMIECGILQSLNRLEPGVLETLRAHVDLEHEAVTGGNVGSRTCLLGDFHILLVGAVGNALLTEIIRDLTARTTLVSMLYQSDLDAVKSSEDHLHIVSQLEAGRFPEAARTMAAHILRVEAGLKLNVDPDPLAELREMLSPAVEPLSKR